MGSQAWTRWVAIGLVVLVALSGSVIGALSLGGDASTTEGSPSPAPEGLAGSTVVLPLQPLGLKPVEDDATATAREEAAAFGQGVGARTVYAVYARDGRTLEVTGIMPAAGTALRRALEDSPGRAIARQFVNVGQGEGRPYPSRVPGVSLRCGEPRTGRLACIWADSSVLTLMSWRLGRGADLADAARLSASLIPQFRRPA